MNSAEFEILLRRVVDRWNARLAVGTSALRKIEFREMEPQNAWLRWSVDTYTQFEGGELEHNELQAVVMWGPPDDVRVLPGDRLFALLLERGLRATLDREREAERDPLKIAMRELNRILPINPETKFRPRPKTVEQKILIHRIYVKMLRHGEKQAWLLKEFGGSKQSPKLPRSTVYDYPTQ